MIIEWPQNDPTILRNSDNFIGLPPHPTFALIKDRRVQQNSPLYEKQYYLAEPITFWLQSMLTFSQPNKLFECC